MSPLRPAAVREDDMNKLLGAAALAAFVAFSPAAFAQQSRGPVIGVSWSNFQEERWKTDEAAIKAAIERAGGTYLSADAQSSPAKQLADVESLIARGAKALIVLAQDASAIRPAIDKALNEGVSVVGYDRLIENPRAFYLTFDNIEVGRMMAREIQKAKPEGNYVFIKGSGADPNAGFLFQGSMEVLKPAIDAGGSRMWARPSPMAGCPPTPSGTWSSSSPATTTGWTPWWPPMTARPAAPSPRSPRRPSPARSRSRSGCGPRGAEPHRARHPDHDGVEGRARTRQGGGGDRHPARGWQEARGSRWRGEVGQGPTKAQMNAIFLKPVAITKDNLNVVIEAGWAPKSAVCQGVPAGRVAACN